MLAFVIAMILGQFTPDKEPQMSLEKYTEKCMAIKAKDREKELAQLKGELIEAKARAKKSMSARKFVTPARDALEKFEKSAAAKTGLPDLKIMVTQLNPGSVGKLHGLAPRTLTLPRNLNDSRSGYSRTTVYDVVPAGIKVFQVINNSTMLCESTNGGDLFVVIGNNEARDGDGISSDLIYAVTGRYTYTATGGAKRTVPVLAVWEHYREWQEQNHPKKAVAEKKPMTPEPAKKK